MQRHDVSPMDRTIMFWGLPYSLCMFLLFVSFSTVVFVSPHRIHPWTRSLSVYIICKEIDLPFGLSKP